MALEKTLTNNNRSGILRFGRIVKGAPQTDDKKRIGNDLDYFRPKFEDPALYPLFTKIYGETPTRLWGCDLFSATSEGPFSAWMKQYDAKKDLIRKCNEVTQVSYQLPDGTFSNQPIPCIHDAQKPCQCDRVIEMHVILRPLCELAGTLGFVTITSGSINDALQWDAFIKQMSAMYGVNGLPVIFTRAKERIFRKDASGKRFPMEKSLVKVELDLSRMGEHAPQRQLPRNDAPQLQSENYSEEPPVEPPLSAADFQKHVYELGYNKANPVAEKIKELGLGWIAENAKDAYRYAKIERVLLSYHRMLDKINEYQWDNNYLDETIESLGLRGLLNDTADLERFDKALAKFVNFHETMFDEEVISF